MRIISPIGYYEDSRGFFLVDKFTLDLMKVPLGIYKRWKQIVEDKMGGRKR